jgi:hypothetical protein
MPKGRSTFTKRLKEQARQQRQREKAQRRSERKEAKAQEPTDEMRELREQAEAQAALFRVGLSDSATSPVEPPAEHREAEE